MSTDTDATRYIISDLHLGKNDDFDIFKANGKEAKFEEFLRSCSGQKGSVELVINGDFVDFLQLEPWSIYAGSGKKADALRAAAVKKATEIAAGQARVFKALGAFLAEEKNRLVVLLGNHDIELAYDEVWTIIREAITKSPGVAGRIDFKNRATQYNFRLSGVLVHVEHGNIGDEWNEIDYTGLFNHAEKNTDFDFPPGTLFVYGLMNDFKKKFRFIDLLKPEMPTVPLLLAQFEPLAAAGKIPKAMKAKLSAIKNGFVGQLQSLVGGKAFNSKDKPFGSEEELGIDEQAYRQMAQRYQDRLPAAEKNLKPSVDHLEDFLSKRDVMSAVGTEAGFGPRLDRVRAYLADSVLNYLGRPAQPEDKAFFQTDQKGADVDLAEKQLKGDVKVVVFGHTHAALKAEIPGKGLYVNSGTWANLLSLPKAADYAAWRDSIYDNSFKPLVFPTYVRLAAGKNGLDASLNYWSDAGEAVLWSKHISA